LPPSKEYRKGVTPPDGWMVTIGVGPLEKQAGIEETVAETVANKNQTEKTSQRTELASPPNR